MNYSGHYGTFYNLTDDDCEKLERHGFVFGAHDEHGERDPVFVPQHASGNLRYVPEMLENPFRSGPGVWWELHPRQSETVPDAINTDTLSLEALLGETAMARFAEQTLPGTFSPDRDPAFWSRRAQRCHAAFCSRLQSMSPLVRVAAEGEIELATGKHGAPGEAPAAITIRVYLDRQAGEPLARDMVIETVIAPEDLHKQLGARVATAQAELLAVPDAQVYLLGRHIPLEGKLAERIGRADWSPAHAHRAPPLRLMSIDDAIGWAKNSLPHFNFAEQEGLPKQAVLSLYQTQGRTERARRPSLQDVLDAARALEDAKLMLERSLDLGRQWLAQRIGHVLDAEARYDLAAPPRISEQFRAKDQHYVISIDGPGSANPRHPQPTVYWTGQDWTTDLALAGRYTTREASTLLEGALRDYPFAGTARHDALAKRAAYTDTLTP
ncbi:MAG TPA: hypothetical protein VGD46_18755 [Rhizobacter sp.]